MSSSISETDLSEFVLCVFMLSDAEAARREAHQACLRAYLQICMDHHVGGLLDGAAVATLRTRTHTICKVRVRLSEELVARISRQVMLVLACRCAAHAS